MQHDPCNILLDANTLRMAAAAIGENRKRNVSSAVRDMGIVGIAHLVESIVLGERVLLPGVERALPSIEALDLVPHEGIEVIEESDHLVNILDARPKSLKAKKILTRWRTGSQLGNFLPILETIGLVFEVATGDGFSEFWSSVKRGTYEYLVSVNPDNSDRLSVLEAYDEDYRFRLRESEREEAQRATNLFRHHNDVIENMRNGEYLVMRQVSRAQEIDRLHLAVAWLIDRSIHYSLLASILGAVYFPCSIRANVLGLTNLTLSNRHRPELSGVRILIDKLNRSLNDSIHPMLRDSEDETSFVSLKYPPIFQYICSKVHEPQELVPYALDIRASAEFTSLRGALTDVESARAKGDNRALHSATREFERAARYVSDWLVGKELVVRPAKLLRLLGVEIEPFDNYVMSLELPHFLQRPYFPGQPHFALLRDLTEDLLEVYALGESYERLFR